MVMQKRTKSLDKRVARAVRHFWETRSNQGRQQGVRSGRRDHGNRAVATGGKQLDGFNNLICELLGEAGVPKDAIFCRRRADITLPGFFRPTKQWDVVVVAEGNLLASVECKALCGPSFGNNYNNRIEEAVGSATDIWTAYREGAFDDSPRPFLGYVLMLESAAESESPVRVHERHFRVFEEFQGASYAERCEECLRRLVRERCYDSAAYLCSSRTEGARGKYREPASDLNFSRSAKLLCRHVVANFEAIR